MEQNFPNFLCVGAAKSATTTFANMIKAHPDVFTPVTKELHYFDQEHYQKENCRKYSNYFENANYYKVRAEFTPNYLYYEEIPGEIADLLGNDIKILIMLRNPVDRAFSHYMMARDKGYETKSFKDAFYSESKRMQKSYQDRRVYSYFDRSLYTKQVKRYLKQFDYVKIVLFEDFVKNNNVVMEEVFDFLGIEKISIPLVKSNERKNAKYVWLNCALVKLEKIVARFSFIKKSTLLKKAHGKIIQFNSKSGHKKQNLDLDFAKELQQYFYQDVCELENLINRDLSHWKNKY